MAKSEDTMRSVDEDIKSGSFQNMYLFYGEEAYLVGQYKKKLVKALVQEQDTMNFYTCEGKDMRPGEIIDLAETMPFFADYRMILMENTGVFKNACEELAEYLKGMSSDSQTIFLFVEQEVDKRSKMYKAVKEKGRCIEFARQTDQILGQWILQKLRRENKKITQSAMQLFLTKTGNDMELIDRELEKLVCYCLERDAIQVEDVEAVCVEQISNKIFDMVNAIAEKNQKMAMDLYYDLLSLKEPPMRILFLVLRQFHILFQVKSAAKAGMGQQQIASICKVPSFAVRKYQSQARSFSMEELKSAMGDGIQAEENVKTGRMNDQLAVELMIIKYSTKKTSA